MNVLDQLAQPHPQTDAAMLAGDSYTIVPAAIDASSVAEIVRVLPESTTLHTMRNLLQMPAIRALADSRQMRGLAEPVLGKTCRAVRGILFDKTPDANWKVAWHQDLSIAVKQRVDAAGYGPWSVKAGVQHVQPPVEVLEKMLTLRLHLDDCGEDNGPLRVLPGSHLLGILSPEAVNRSREQTPARTCLCPAGGVLMMRPLLLHASSPATSPRHRRVIHIEYGTETLSGGLQWHET